jgi:hypothetical protein
MGSGITSAAIGGGGADEAGNGSASRSSTESKLAGGE